MINDVATMGEVHGTEFFPIAPVDTFYQQLGGEPADRPAPVSGSTPRRWADLRRAVPVPSTARIFCVGANYASHGTEVYGTKFQPPSTPNIFGRWPQSLSPSGAEIALPPGDDHFDWEGELAAIIGRSVRRSAASQDGDKSIFAFTCFNDLSARVYQKATSQWTLGKNADGSGPIGPELVTPDELGDPYGLKLSTRLNGIEVQSASTGDMIFRFSHVIRYIAGCMRLQPGDVIASGTPKGVGNRMQPPRFLTPGDEVEVEIQNIGVLACTVTAGA